VDLCSVEGSIGRRPRPAVDREVVGFPASLRSLCPRRVSHLAGFSTLSHISEDHNTRCEKRHTR
jgi:hypothetical protein